LFFGAALFFPVAAALVEGATLFVEAPTEMVEEVFVRGCDG
jgi:hypothetical protein